MIEPALATSPRVLWVVDVNRQSLDRVIPGIRVQVWREMLAANGWRVIDAKYGSLLEEAFARPNGELLREAIDSMPNETYHSAWCGSRSTCCANGCPATAASPKTSPS